MVIKEPDEASQDHRDRLLSIGQVAAGIAHEVKNPLTSVKGFLQLLRERYSDDYIDIAETELDNAISIIGDFLQVTKPELSFESYQPVNIAAELESVLALFLDRQYNVAVIKHFKNTDVRIYAKKQHLKRAFFNLVKNAFESIPDKGTIRVEQYIQGTELMVTIEDSGIGIDGAKLRLLGTPFFTTKDDGTGMGLTQVYSTIYEHGGRIHVESTLGIGTKFFIHIPLGERESVELVQLDVVFKGTQSLQEYVEANKDTFRRYLLQSAGELTDTLKEIKEQSGVDLVANALSLVDLAIGNHPHELTVFAQAEGKLWAKHSLQVSFKLTWLKIFKEALWQFIYNYFLRSENGNDVEFFFQTERHVNAGLDSFLTNFTISYNQFKDDLLHAQRELVEDLSVPIIPLLSTVSILPLIGTIDTFRAGTVQKKVLHAIEDSRIETMIVDLSGVSYLDTGVLNHLFNLFEGIQMMGCKVIVTGIRAEIASALVKTGLSIGSHVITKGTLQQALDMIGLSAK